MFFKMSVKNCESKCYFEKKNSHFTTDQNDLSFYWKIGMVGREQCYIKLML